MGRRWTQKEVEFLRENYAEKGRTWCALKLERKENSIKMKCAKLGLVRPPEKRSDVLIGRKRPGHAKLIRQMWKDGRLKPHPSPFKGQKLPPEMCKQYHCPSCGGKRERHSQCCRKCHWIFHEHPRGALGHKHSDFTKEKMSQKALAAWENPNSGHHTEEAKQRRSDLMMEQRRKQPASSSPYSRGKQGKRADIGIYVRSSWEANYARYLNWLKKAKIIFKWEYEPDTFEFTEIKRGTRSYTPDFKIWDKEESKPRYIEIKGWMDDKSRVRLKRMKKYYPEVCLLVINGTEYKSLAKKWRKVIPNWE